jgi:hypothetical protein
MTRPEVGKKDAGELLPGEPPTPSIVDVGAAHIEFWPRLIAPALAVLAALLWLFGLHPVAPAQMGSLGLITALSPALLVAYPVLVAAVVVEITSRPPRPRLLAALTALAVLLVYGLQPASEPTARLSVAWLHTGFAHYIADNGHALQGFDARFSWPGFFSLIAFITKASGVPDATLLLQWAPVVLAGLATLGMRALAVVILGNSRAAWLATWLFLLAQWTEQDYFSPQATTYVLMLAAVAVTARYLVNPGLAAPRPPGPRGRLPPANLPRERLAAHALVVLLALALAPSHQLTPFVLAGLLLVMVLTRSLWPGWLPWVVLISALVWFSLGAKDFWQGQLQMVVGDFGNVTSSVDQGVGGRFVGDAGRTAILLVRVGITGAVALLALAGWWIRRRHGFRSWALPLLAIAPFGMVTVQSYGGEVFVRCYLFALPFASILGAFVLERPFDIRPCAGSATDSLGKVAASWAARVAPAFACAVLSVLGLATVVARGGNDAYTSFSRSDVAATQAAYGLATPGQTISGLTSDALPLGYAQIGVVEQSTIGNNCPDFSRITTCVLTAAPDYLIVTPSQDIYGQIYYGEPPGWSGRLVTDLDASGAYRIIFRQDDSQVLAKAVAAG